MTSPPNGASQADGRFSLRLFAAFFLIALVFVASSVFSSWLSLEMESNTYDLTANALPSIEHLSRAIDALRDLEADADDYADLPQERPTIRIRLEKLRRVVTTELASYRALPEFPEESALFANVPDSLAALDASTGRLFEDVGSAGAGQSRAAADTEVRTRVDRTTTLLRELVTLDASHASDTASRLLSSRRRTTIIAASLDALTLVFTMGIAVWIWRLFRSYARLQGENAQLIQHRADELEQHARELQEASVTDELTGLLNRRGFLLIAEQEMKAAIRNARPLTLFFVDLNGMKTINDTLGHKMGDRALVDTAAVLRAVFRGSDVIGRLGGDEFVVLAPDAPTASEAQCTDRLRRALETYNETSTPFRLSLSMGASIFDPSAPITLQKLLADADKRMYEQKRQTRGASPGRQGLQ